MINGVLDIDSAAAAGAKVRFRLFRLSFSHSGEPIPDEAICCV